MSSIFTPQNQIKLTNVSVVRLKKAGKRFELACYKNKIIEYRNKITKDLDEVLQTQTIFTNVSKGQIAKKEDLMKSFNTEDQKTIVLEILNKGELQVSVKEREYQVENLRKDIATIVSEKCINPLTNRPYTVSMIEKAMSDLHISIKTELNAKQQALDVIKQLEKNKNIPIQRVQMRIKIHCQYQYGKKLKELLVPLTKSDPSQALISRLVSETWEEDDVEFECLIDPGKLKAVTEIVQLNTKGEGNVYTVNINETLLSK